MNNSKLREALLELENINPTIKEKYEKEVNKIIENPLSPWQRVAWYLWAFMGLCFMLGFAGLALFLGDDLPWQGRTAFGLGSLFGIIWFILCLIIAKKGSFSFNRDGFVLCGVTWAFLIIVTVVFLLLGSELNSTAKGVLVILSNLTFIVVFGFILTWGRVAITERRIGEKLLRLELQFVGLSEHLFRAC